MERANLPDVVPAAEATIVRTTDDGPGPRRDDGAMRRILPVVFPTTGFRPHERITVNLAPTLNRGGNCCGIDVITKARADAHGKAILHFRWPRTYFNGDERVAWSPGARADVLVITPAYAKGRKVVRVRG
jgi:hypothetical protein